MPGPTAPRTPHPAFAVPGAAEPLLALGAPAGDTGLPAAVIGLVNTTRQQAGSGAY